MKPEELIKGQPYRLRLPDANNYTDVLYHGCVLHKNGERVFAFRSRNVKGNLVIYPVNVLGLDRVKPWKE